MKTTTALQIRRRPESYYSKFDDTGFDFEQWEGRPATYQAHLQSQYWLNIRRIKLREAKNKCQCCPATTHLQVHHLSYEFVGYERRALWTLAVLCESCHHEIHENDLKGPDIRFTGHLAIRVDSDKRAGMKAWTQSLASAIERALREVPRPKGVKIQVTISNSDFSS